MARNPAVLVSLISDWDGRDLDKGIKELEKARKATQTMSDKMGAFGSKMQDVGKKVSHVGGTLTKSLTLPIVGLGAAATAMAVEFDSSMAKITALVGIAADEVDGMRKSVLELSGETAKSPAELADALFVVTSAGLRGEAALNALEQSAKAGAAGLGQTNDIARALAGAMNAYGPSVVDAARATDMIVATARAGNFETSQFAGAIGRVLPFAQQAGSSLEDMGGAVALLTRTNGDAAQSVTQVAALFRAFVVPTEQAKKSLEGVGLTAGDVRDAIAADGLPAALTMLEEKLGGNREELGKLLGSSEAAAAAFQILDADAQTITDTFGAVNEAAGITDEAFGVVSDTAGFKLQQAFTTLKTSLIEFGDVIAPFLTSLAERVKTIGDTIQNLDPQTKRFIVIAGAIAAAIGPVLLIVGKLIVAVGSLITVLSGFTVAGAILAGKVLLVVAAVAAVVVAFKMMYDRSESLRRAVGTLIGTVQNIAKTLFGDVVNAFKSVTSVAGDTSSIFDRVATIAGNVLAVAVQALTRYWNFLANGLRVVIKVYEVAFTIIRMVATLIRGAFIAAIDILLNKLGPVSTALRSLADGVRSAFTQAVSIVRAAINNAGKFLASFINGAIGIVNKMIDAYNSLEGIIPGVTRVANIAEMTFNDMTASVESAANSANNLANDIGGYASQVMRGNQATDAAYNSFTALGTAADATGDDVAGLTGDLNDSAGGASKADEAATRYTAALQKMKDRLGEWRKGLKKDLDDAREEFFRFSRDVATAITGSIDLGGAFEGAAERTQAIADAEKALAEARAAAAQEGAGESAAARVLAAEADLARAKSQGETLGLTFMEALNAQAEQAREYGAKVQQILTMDLDPNSPLMQLILGSSHSTGIGIMDELITGGVTTIQEAEELLGAVQQEADDIGLLAAGHFKGAGVDSALATVEGFDSQFGPGGPGRKQLMRIMDRLAAKMARQAIIDIQVTKHVNEVVTRVVQEIRAPAAGVEAAGATGAIVRRPTFALIGEAGPEALIPLDRTRGNSPVSDLAMGAGITINVNAGMGTDGAEVGRQIVDAIRKYERRSGPVFAGA